MANTIVKSNAGLAKLKAVLNTESMQQNFKNILADNAGAFSASIIELYQNDADLQKCDPNKVLLQALKAATLKLPLTKALGFSYIIPYGTEPTFILGYKGLVQLAQRSGQYRYINADVVYEGETVKYDRVTGMLTIEGTATSDNAIGYFAFFELLNGFRKSVYWTKEQVIDHAQKYSKAWKKASSPWHTQFDSMAIKTVLKSILSKYGVMSVEFANAFAEDSADEKSVDTMPSDANEETIEIPEDVTETTEAVQESFEEIDF